MTFRDCRKCGLFDSTLAWLEHITSVDATQRGHCPQNRTSLFNSWYSTLERDSHLCSYLLNLFRQQIFLDASIDFESGLILRGSLGTPCFETVAHRAVQNMEGIRRSGLAALSIGILLSARTVKAHGGHDMSKIVEGSYISAEPIVRGTRNQKEVAGSENTDAD